jgi:CheY-like chemotaxis protein
LSRRLVELHGGKLTARSKGPGLGSEFIICLPLDTAHQDPETAKAISPSAPLAPYKILIIDDHPSSAESTAELLKVKGHDVRYAVTGWEGLELARAFKPEIALIDIVLPDISGYECAAILRENPDTRHAKLIAITGMPPSPEDPSAHQSVFDSYFIKPITIKDIELWIAARMLGE